MATAAHVAHIKAMTTGTAYNVAIIADNAALTAAIVAFGAVGLTVTLAEQATLIAAMPVDPGFDGSRAAAALMPITPIVPPVINMVPVNYVIKKAVQVNAVKASATAAGITQTFQQKALANVIRFGNLSTVDIGESIRTLHDYGGNQNIFNTAKIIAGMTSAITAATANDDAPWASLVYAEFAGDLKLALRGFVSTMRAADPTLLTHFNRCGFILSGVASDKDGAWLRKYGNVIKADVSTWWPAAMAWADKLPVNAKKIATSKITAQSQWCVAHPAEVAALLA
jgi:hypothetical protein